jgi:hypothetical protein
VTPTWTFSLLGTTFSVTADPRAQAALRATLAGVGTECTDQATSLGRISGLTIEGPDCGIQTYPTELAAVVALAGQLELYAAERCPNRIAIHAGVVALGNNALLLPGRSLVGKSTLTKALIDAGADYLSDEYALLDTDGLVHPYPRPLRLRQPGSTTKIVSPPPDTSPEPRRVALISALRHDDSGWAVSPMSKAQAVLRLIDNAVPAQTRAEETLQATTAAARTAGAIEGTRGEASEAAYRLMDLLR